MCCNPNGNAGIRASRPVCVGRRCVEWRWRGPDVGTLCGDFANFRPCVGPARDRWGALGRRAGADATLTGVVEAGGHRAVPCPMRVTVLDTSGELIGIARTDDNGRYLVTDLPGGNHVVVTRAVGAVVGAPLGARLVRRWSLRPVAVPALTAAALSMGAVGLLDLHTPLVWIEIMLLVQGLSVGMVLAPVTGALLSSLSLEQSGAGSAVTNTARQAGSVIGIAVGGTIMSIAYRGAIEPSLSDVPEALQDKARVSAEQARHVAAALDRPTLAQAADHAFIHSMHVGAVWIMLIGLFATAVLVFALRPAGRPTGSARKPDDGRGSSRSAAGAGPRAGTDNQSTYSGADIDSH